MKTQITSEGKQNMTKTTCVLGFYAVIIALAISPTIAQENLTRTQYEKMVWEHKDRAIKKLASDSAPDRYSALLDLLSCTELPSETVKTVIEYLADLRGEFPGNTVAGAAAELLAKHPQYARLAIPQLLILLSYREKYGFPAASASEALGAIDRRYLEEYFAGMTGADRKALSAMLSPIIQSYVGHLGTWARVCEILAMLGPDAANALDAIKARNIEARKWEKDNPFAIDVRVRSDAALRIIQSGWSTGDPQYIAEMRQADAALGKSDAYIKPEARFSDELSNFLELMKEAAIKTGYVIRNDSNFPFQARAGGIPMARLITNQGYSFLYEGLDLKGSHLPQKPMILLTTAGKKAYAYTFHPTMDPEYLPSQDFVFIEIGANGPDPLNQFFKTFGFSEGYDESILYVYWPHLWWLGAEKVLLRPPPLGKQLRWLKVTDGQLVSVMFDDK